MVFGVSSRGQGTATMKDMMHLGRATTTPMDADLPSKTLAKRRLEPMTWPVCLMSVGVLVLACALAFVTLDNWGRSRRVPRDGSGRHELFVAGSGIEALSKLEQTGMRGAYLIRLGASPAFARIDFTGAVPTDSVKPGRAYPPPAVDVQRYYVQNLQPANYMLVAARTELARKIDQVLPPSVFGQFREASLANPSPDVTVGTDSVRIDSEGEVRHVLSRLPETTEDFALLVDASYFSETSPQHLLDELRPRASQISFIAVSTDDGDPQVDDATRQRTREFASLVASGLK